MMPMQILARPKDSVQCSSCKQRFFDTNVLDQHLQTTSLGRRVCPKTRAPALVVCVDCERAFDDIKTLEQHFKDSFLHNPEFSKPTGRSIFVGRLPIGVKEQDIHTLFEGFVIETTSMLTHRPPTDNFTFVTLTTVDAAKRAVKELHGRRLFGSRIVVQPHRSNGAKASQANAQRMRIPINMPMLPGDENIKMQSPVKQHSPKRKTPAATSAKSKAPAVVSLRGSAAPFHPPLTNRTMNRAVPSGFVPGRAPSIFQHSPADESQSHRRHQPQRFPPSYDGASDDYPPSSNESPKQQQFSSTATTSGFDPHAKLFMPSVKLPSVSLPLVSQEWPPLVSAGPKPEPRIWTSIPKDQRQKFLDYLTGSCHSVNSLTASGFNVTKPIMPPKSELEARVKCKNCRQSRRQIEFDAEGLGEVACPGMYDGRHNFGGCTHLADKYIGFEYSPKPLPHVSKRQAIALDCEMAGGWNGDGFVDELIQLTAIDYLTGEILISTLVAPSMQIRQWRTSIHGVSRNMMEQAIRTQTAMYDCKSARAALFSLMDENTILIGHALHHDLNVLKISHRWCVDSEILAVEAVSRPGLKQTGLKKLCDSLMSLSVQRASTHSCLEDSFAAREAVIYMTTHLEALAQWAGIQQKRLDDEQAKREEYRQAKEAAREEHRQSKAAIREQASVAAAISEEIGNAIAAVEVSALIPTPATDIPAEMQTERGPSAGKKRKGGQWKKPGLE